MAKQLFFLALVPSLLLQAAAPDRKASGTISSSHYPNVQIQLPKSAEYVGADRWIVDDTADCELHAIQAKRKELMILYGGELAPAGYAAADLKAGASPTTSGRNSKAA